jgi:REP element-mobilizing transposase RayT
MVRKLRVEYPGAVYSMLNRGDRRVIIYRDDTDRQHFVDTLAEACEMTAWQVHALCLMSNHLHLVVGTPQPNLVAGRKWCLGRERFREELPEQIQEGMGAEHYGEERRELTQLRSRTDRGGGTGGPGMGRAGSGPLE